MNYVKYIRHAYLTRFLEAVPSECFEKESPKACHFEQSARPGALHVMRYELANPGLGQGEIFALNLHVGIRFLPSVEMTDGRGRSDEEAGLLTLAHFRHSRHFSSLV
jgi:hypothetical protein